MVRPALLLTKGDMGVEGGRGIARLWADEYCCADTVER
jgi:hypothetical protein